MMGSWTPAAGERVLLIAAALALSILAGAFVAEFDIIWVIGILGVLCAVALILSREATLWFIVVTGIALVGTGMMYVPGAGPLKYIPPLAAVALVVHMVSEWMQHPRRPVPSTVPWLLGFLGVSVISFAANWEGFGMAAVGLKTYYPMWPLFLALAMIHWRPQVIDSLPKAALWLAFLQLPFVAHQFLVLVPMRQNMPGVVPVDIVAGTFGGDVRGGGANSVMTLFLIMVAAGLLGLWRHGALSGPRALGGALLLLSPILLNSARAALLYLPLVFGLVFAADIVRRPLRALAGFLAVGLFVAGMLTTYTAFNPSPNTNTWQDLLRQTFEYQLASERERENDYSSLSRWTALTFWWQRQKFASPLETLVGHGPGSSRVEEDGLDLAHTLAERRYGGRQIGYTAVAALLWDVGVLGLLLVLGLFWAGWRQARRLVRHYQGRDPTRAGIAEGLSATMVILTLSLAHKDFFVFHIPYQTMLVCVFGYLAAQVQRIESTVPDRRMRMRTRAEPVVLDG
ncbi:MAG TPA: hypothetical protein VF210_08575 [Pseudomonadales bacterium]